MLEIEVSAMSARHSRVQSSTGRDAQATKSSDRDRS
jgi:hypothetical protein